MIPSFGAIYFSKKSKITRDQLAYSGFSGGTEPRTSPTNARAIGQASKNLLSHPGRSWGLRVEVGRYEDKEKSANIAPAKKQKELR